MSQYSLMVGSFIRTGNYPMEANFIFANYEELANFYSDEILKATLHKGLLKLVEDDGNGYQALFWVTETDGELSFTKLVAGEDFLNTINKVNEISERLDTEIEERKNADLEILGTDNIEDIPEDLNSILDLANALTKFREDFEESEKKILSEITNIYTILKAISGSSSEEIVEYLETLDFKNLTEISETLHKFLDTRDPDDEKVNTLLELLDFLDGFTNNDTLKNIINDLREEIWGDPTPNTQFRTLRGIQDFVLALASTSKNREDNLQTELDQTQVGIGLSGDGSYNADNETYYLKNATSVMNALKILDSLINQAINNCNLESANTNSVDINITKEVDKTIISAQVKLASEVSNDILSKSDGLYTNIDSEYENGILTIKVNGNIRQQHVLGLSSVVDDAYYDIDREAIIIIFKLHDGNTQTITIPAASLISEWEVDNTIPNKVVHLEKLRVTGGGADKLSADVRLSSNQHNILVKDNNTLLVEGTADNIVYNGDITVKDKLDLITQEESNINNLLNTLNNDINAEINRAKIAEQSLSNDITLLRTNVETQDLDLANQIALEKTRAEAAEANLNTKIEAVKENVENDISTKITTLLAEVNNEIQRSTTEDSNIKNSLTEVITNLNSEVLRATNAEELLAFKIDTLKESIDDNLISDDSVKKAVDDLKLADITLQNKIDQEVSRASNSETLLGHRIDDVNDRIDTVKENVENNIGTKISSLQDTLNQEISRSTLEDADSRTKLSELSTSISNETTRAKAEESVIRNELTSETQRASQKEDFIDSRITDHILDHNNPHLVTAEQINAYTKDKVNELLQSVDVRHEVITDKLNDSLLELTLDFSEHIIDYSNPHKVTKAQIGLDKVDNTTDLEKPISVAVQEALHNLDLDIATKVNQSDFNHHLADRDNPHNVTKEQLSLGNVDNTSDMIKPISIPTQMALDKKADINHTHKMSEIEDLENLPIIKGFVEVMGELPSNPAVGDKYIVVTPSDPVSYTLCDYDGSRWIQKLLTTGGIVTVIDGDVWKLNSSGIERVLDVSDYNYFYNKIYEETKNLIEDIDWEEDDAVSETNNLIRLKITYKKSYGDPNEDEATNPYLEKAVKYIDIEKARFLSDIYSRPATELDVNNGYATKVGEPMLVLVLTTGNYVAVSLKDTLNIYDPIDTASIDMEVTDWTGTPNTSYKVSAVVRLASTEDKKSAVSLHILDTTEKGLYAELHTSNTNSISLNPTTGANGTQKTLTANLNIDNTINNNSNIVLNVSSNGLSAEFVWAEYD